MAATAATSPLDPDTAITRNIKMRMARDEVVPEVVAPKVGMSMQTFYRRFKVGGWRANEVARIALFFGEPVDAFYRDPRIAGRQPTDGRPADLRTLSLLPFQPRRFTPLAA